MKLVTNVTKREYPITVRRRRGGKVFTMLLTAESEAAARLLVPDTVEIVDEPQQETMHKGE